MYFSATALSRDYSKTALFMLAFKNLNVEWNQIKKDSDLIKEKIVEYQCHPYHSYDECQSQICTRPSSSTSSILNELNIADIDEPNVLNESNVINEKENVSVLKSKHAAPVQAMRLRELNDINSQIASLTTICEFGLAIRN
ncbi:unnamed protein product [Didymodactylos carnosus]|uniref:Uncharacterized protein n=1 Tax=Didymodactylos carnosus TaxID=1234261 RepID=A0A815YJG2_9BILA|nr:unnamed protein product [Didymodactylos carnosus]CAF4435459.1 unnamed protein product [Didymodactylos carnosus]